MITKLEIDNLKSIQHLQTECSDVNLFIGINSSGKSSIIQGLLFLAQNVEGAVGLNGRMLSLGTLKENRCVFGNSRVICAGIEDDKGYELKVQVSEKGNRPSVERRYSTEMHLQEYSVEKRKVQYLSCHRVGARNVYEKNLAIDESIGINGEYAIAYLDSYGKEPLEPRLCKGNQDYTLLGQVNQWLSYIVGTEISTEAIVGANLVQASYSMGELQGIRPQNVGSGISYLISVLIMCLSSPERGILVIENPEIHLHPSAQAKVCEFLYFIALSGRQLFVESHSDHIFNGFRAGIATGEMDREKINIQFVSLNAKHMTESMRVEIGRMGRIENQRKDLFDQFDMDMNKMIGVRG